MSHPLGRSIPEGARLIHIGPHKTGSTAIQVSLHRARAELAESGVFYPGSGTRPRRAGWALGIRGGPVGKPKPPMSHWNALVDQVAAAGEQRVCISNEDFGRATEEQIAALVEGLGGERVHVVAVARRYDRYLPSQWQERVKAGDTRSYDEWLRVVLDVTNRKLDWDRRNVWFSHNTPLLVERWAKFTSVDRITVIAGDESDRTQQVRAFEKLLALPAETLAVYSDRSNRGLSWWEADFVRQLHMISRDQGWDYQTRRKMISRGVIADLMSRPTPTDGPRTPPMPTWAIDTVRELSRKRVDELREFDVNLVGELDSLLLPDDVVVGDQADQPLTGTGSAAATVAAMLTKDRQEAIARQARVVESEPQASWLDTFMVDAGETISKLGHQARESARSVARALKAKTSSLTRKPSNAAAVSTTKVRDSAANQPGQGKGDGFPADYDEAAKERIRLVKKYTMTSPEKLFALITGVRYVVDADIPGALVECGVWRGGSMHAIARTLDERGVHDRRLYLFDTFEGMTEPTERDHKIVGGRAADLLKAQSKETWVWAIASIEDVEEGLRTLPYPFDMFTMVKGPVEETIPEQAPDEIALLRLDTDWYESTKHELVHLYERLQPGGVLIIDDYGTWAGSKEATDEFLAELPLAPLMLRAGRSRIGVKPGR